MKYCFDLDETICATPASRNYGQSVPYVQMIQKINELHDAGNHVTIFTARGSSSGVDYYDMTKSQIISWGLKFHDLITKKPSYDLFVDDKAINTTDWKKQQNISTVGLVASAFDLLHTGHCLYLKESKVRCDYLIAALHIDPSIERPSKNKPIQTFEERVTQLQSSKYVDEVAWYTTEEQLEDLIRKRQPDIRFLGEDCRGKPITGEQYCKQIFYHPRNHHWSSSELRKRIRDDC